VKPSGIIYKTYHHCYITNYVNTGRELKNVLKLFFSGIIPNIFVWEMGGKYAIIRSACVRYRNGRPGGLLISQASRHFHLH